jgi:hypothetical protein
MQLKQLHEAPPPTLSRNISLPARSKSGKRAAIMDSWRSSVMMLQQRVQQQQRQQQQRQQQQHSTRASAQLKSDSYGMFQAL